MKVVYRRFQYTLNDGDVIPVAATGRFLTILENTSASDLEFSVGNEPFQKIPKGISVELADVDEKGNPLYFDDVRIKNSTGGAATITFALSAGRIYDNRVVISSTTVLLVNPTGATLTTPAKYTAGTIAPGTPAVAAAGATREVWIYNAGANVVWWGDSTVDGSLTRGIPIQPGQTAIIDTAAAIYLRAVGGSSDCGINQISS